MELEASLKEWTKDQRQLVFPNTVGGVTRCGAFHELVWQRLLRAAGLPCRKPHAMRHSYATWLLEAGADIRWVKDQMVHASPRSARPRGPTGTSYASVTKGTSTTSTRFCGAATRPVTGERSSPTAPSVPPRPTASHRRLVDR